METEKRKIHIDILRIIAAFCVIFIHTPGFPVYQERSGYLMWIYSAISVIAKTSVPIFFMITGAVLLHKEESIGTILKKRLLRIVVILFMCSLVLYQIMLPEGEAFSLDDLVHLFVAEAVPHAYPYWFLYAYMGFLLMLPFLRRAVKGMGRNDFIYILVIHFLINSLLPVLNYVLPFIDVESYKIAPHLSIPIMLENTIFLPIVGYWLEQKWETDRLRMPHILILAGAAVFCVAGSCFLTAHEREHYGTYTTAYLVVFDYLLAIIFYLLAKKICTFIPKKCAKGIGVIAGLTMGIYLLDPIWKRVFYNDFYYAVFSQMTVMGFSLCWCLISMTVSGVNTWILKKIPLVKKLF